MNATLTKAQEQDKAIESLRELFAGDDKPVIFTILRHVSSSGMTREISLYYFKNGGRYNITYSAAKALNWTFTHKRGFNAIRVGGCGMDMGFHLVYTLSSVLYRGDDRAGYKLSQEWL